MNLGIRSTPCIWPTVALPVCSGSRLAVKRRRPALDPPVGVATTPARYTVRHAGLQLPRAPRGWSRATDQAKPGKSSSRRSPGALGRGRTSCTDRFANSGCRWVLKVANSATRSPPKNPHSMDAVDRVASNSGRSPGTRKAEQSSPSSPTLTTRTHTEQRCDERAFTEDPAGSALGHRLPPIVTLGQLVELDLGGSDLSELDGRLRAPGLPTSLVHTAHDLAQDVVSRCRRTRTTPSCTPGPWATCRRSGRGRGVPRVMFRDQPAAALGARGMPGAQWFPAATLNYAEHALTPGPGRQVAGRDPVRPRGRARRTVTHAEARAVAGPSGGHADRRTP
jgi:hypothetical protein